MRVEDSLSSLFGEAPGGFIVSGAPEQLARISGAPVELIGETAARALEIEAGECGLTASARRARRGHSALAELFAVSVAPPVTVARGAGRMRDGPRDECGVFGLYAPGHEVSRLSYFALYALQHRGQESAGIAAADRGGQIITRRELGLVSQVFDENDLRTLAGELAIGHVRYSTTGSNAWENSQPVHRSQGADGSGRELALGHNGNSSTRWSSTTGSWQPESRSAPPRTRRSSRR